MSSAMDEESDEDIWITQETFRVNPSENLACDPEFISILNDLKKPPVLDEEKEPYDLVNNAKFVGHLPVERVSDIDLLERVKERVPKGTVNNTKWCVTVWEDWKEKRNAECMSSTNDEFFVVPENMVAMRTTELNYWLAKFMMEVRRKTDCQPYHGNTLYQIACGLQRHLRENGRAEINVLEDSQFKLFQDSLDAQMKRLISVGVGVNIKQAEPFTRDEEEILWEKGVLGGHSPQTLLDTMLFLLGKFFALRGGKEHRSLKFKQFTLISGENGKEDKLCYNSFGEKNCQGGLKDRKYRPKKIEHHGNSDKPSRCVVHLFKKYISKW